jgi:hypothetical protein
MGVVGGSGGEVMAVALSDGSVRIVDPRAGGYSRRLSESVCLMGLRLRRQVWRGVAWQGGPVPGAWWPCCGLR